jgi:HprK-related kinase A
MLTVASLSPVELRRRLARGLSLRTGAFVNRITSTVPELATSIGLLYADYPVAGDADMADFHLGFQRSGGLRRWLRPQVHFNHDGLAPFVPLPLGQATPMFEWMMNWCVSSRAHGYLMIHAAVVEKDGCVAILPAPPGSGKSTLCAALVHRGWRLLSDELALIRLEDGMVVPLPRPISLKNASIDVIRRYVPGAVFSRPVHDTMKGTVALLKAPAASIARAAVPARPAWVVFPKYEAGAAATWARIAPARAFMQLAGNAFNYSLLGPAGFDAMAGVIERCDSYDFRYSVLDEAVALFSALTPRQA